MKLKFQETRDPQEMTCGAEAPGRPFPTSTWKRVMPFSRSHKNHPQLQLAQPTGGCKVTASPAGPRVAQGVGIPRGEDKSTYPRRGVPARGRGAGQTPLAPVSAETPGRRLHPAPSAAAVSSPGQSAGSYGSEAAPVPPGRRALREAWT